tara:strand:- start:99 stop:341 length:243 start_codon:yes stop_codon:yes gene_type:complete
MNNVSVFIFGIMFAATAGAAFAFVWKSISMMQEEMNKPQQFKNKIPAPHPEMEGVEWGEELMVVNFEDEDDGDGDVIIRK